MNIVDRPNSITISWNAADISLEDLKIFTAYIADIDVDAARPWALNKRGSAPESPLVTAIGIGSPLIAEIASTGDLSALGAIGYFILHPEKLAGWLARYQAASYRDRRQELEEKYAYLRRKAELEAQGEPILEFETEAAPELEAAAEAEAEAELDM